MNLLILLGIGRDGEHSPTWQSDNRLDPILVESVAAVACLPGRSLKTKPDQRPTVRTQ